MSWNEIETNPNQIIRIDAKSSFVESLNSAFEISKANFSFSSYDISKSVGNRSTGFINSYIDIAEVFELCRKLESGELRKVQISKRTNGDSQLIYQHIGGTTAEKLRKYGKERKDGKSLSRIVSLNCGSKADFIFSAQSGPGEVNEKGLIIPRFGNSPEIKISVAMSFDSFSQLMLITRAHYNAWLISQYMKNGIYKATEKSNPEATQEIEPLKKTEKRKSSESWKCQNCMLSNSSFCQSFGTPCDNFTERSSGKSYDGQATPLMDANSSRERKKENHFFR